ncbi:MAG: alpha/beta hydrolase [Saprospiraceae bacterium]
MRTRLLLLPFLSLTAALSRGEAQLMRVADVLSLPVNAPDLRSAYGPDSLQFGELRLPEDKGLHPVVVIIHGGCWLNAYDLHLMDPMATALTQAGYATWNLEYRRVGDEGGGWPGTFLDIAAGLNHLRELASGHDLDLSRIVVIGHSAGGHLALWLAGQHQLPGDSEIFTRDLVPISGVVSLAGITDPVTYLVREGQSCGTAVSGLLGGFPEDLPRRYQEASPLALAPLGVRHILITGEEDPIVPLAHISPYTDLAQEKGAKIKSIAVPGAGHFEVIAPGSNAWKEVEKAIRKLSKRKRKL